MLWNFYFDLTDDVKIQKLAVNVYFGNNMVMVILLKARIEYPFAHSLSHLKPCNSSKKNYTGNVSLYEWTASIRLKNFEDMAFSSVFYKIQENEFTLIERHYAID